MKKRIALALALVLLFAFVAACGDDDEGDGDLRIALVTHSPTSILEDASFNAGAWEGINRFVAEHEISTDNRFFVQPNDATDAARVDLIESVIEDRGADIIVLPGFDFNFSSHRAQFLFPDTKFILLDTEPIEDWGFDPELNSNLVAIYYAEEQAGFLAGYAAVREGFRELGFLGGRDVPAVVRFGHGFIQGAEHAANYLGLAPGEVRIRYHYTGTFAADPAIATIAGAWYADGTEVIFVCGGRIFDSVIPAAEAAGRFIIGVDGDQSGLSETIITSAMKDLAQSVTDMLNHILDGTFPGGQTLLYDAAGRGIGLPMATSRFNYFTQAMYDAIFAQLADGTVVVSTSLNMSDIVTTLVNVEVH